MATGGPSSHPTATDCPLCGSLCLGPVILPCRDVICRKCLHDVLRQRGLRAACQQCGQRLNLPRDLDMTVSELAQQMGTDPVMDKVVLQELDRATDTPCLNCPSKEAANVCLDCQEYYCDVCSGNHCRSRMASDHVLHQLSQALQDAPSVAQATPTPTPRSSFAMSKSSLSSIRNLPDPQSRDTSRDVTEWEEWVKKQLDLLRRASRDKLQVKTVVQEIVSLGQELLDRIQTDEQILDNYQHFLPRFDVIQRTDPGVYVIQERGFGVRMQVRRQALEGRLCGVRECRHCPDLDSVEGIRTQLDQLLHLADQDSPDLTSMASAGSSTSSSTHTHTSAQLHPAIRAATHTFTRSVESRTASPATTHSFIPSVDGRTATPTTTHTFTRSVNGRTATPTTTHTFTRSVNGRTATPTTTHTFTRSVNVMAATPAATHTFIRSVNVMTATPQHLFTTWPTTADDWVQAFIPAIVCLPNDTLVMADNSNDKVKVMGLAPPHTVSASLTVSERPWSLALLSDGLVAVTTRSPLIYVIKVTDTLTVTSRITTVRTYDGVAGQRDGRLLVSCCKDGAGPAAVHVLTRQGHVMRTVTDSTRLAGLNGPYYICVDGNSHVLVADFWTHLVHRLEVSSGHVTHTYDHTDLRYPRQVCANRAGVVCMASEGGECVMVRNSGGQWRQLLTSDLSDPEYVHPWGLCLTRSGRLVVAWGNYGIDSVVVVYDLV